MFAYRNALHLAPACQEHPTELVSLYCMDCYSLVCNSCVSLDHSNHEWCFVMDAVATLGPEFQGGCRDTHREKQLQKVNQIYHAKASRLEQEKQRIEIELAGLESDRHMVLQRIEEQEEASRKLKSVQQEWELMANPFKLLREYPAHSELSDVVANHEDVVETFRQIAFYEDPDLESSTIIEKAHTYQEIYPKTTREINKNLEKVEFLSVPKSKAIPIVKPTQLQAVKENAALANQIHVERMSNSTESTCNEQILKERLYDDYLNAFEYLLENLDMETASVPENETPKIKTTRSKSLGGIPDSIPSLRFTGFAR
ncbi:hypothetical protein HDV06_002856 [Boothiomyces sp. JEL0866]|nr:hypothetical protein HDV06_002856 [Boothiomyces sp. JEL0866]